MMAMMAVMSKAAKTKAAVVTMVVAAKPKRNERNSITIAITITIRAAIVPVMTTVAAAIAAANGIDEWASQPFAVKSLQEHLGLV